MKLTGLYNDGGTISGTADDQDGAEKWAESVGARNFRVDHDNGRVSRYMLLASGWCWLPDWFGPHIPAPEKS